LPLNLQLLSRAIKASAVVAAVAERRQAEAERRDQQQL